MQLPDYWLLLGPFKSQDAIQANHIQQECISPRWAWLVAYNACNMPGRLIAFIRWLHKVIHDPKPTCFSGTRTNTFPRFALIDILKFSLNIWILFHHPCPKNNKKHRDFITSPWLLTRCEPTHIDTAILAMDAPGNVSSRLGGWIFPIQTSPHITSPNQQASNSHTSLKLT